MNKKIKWGIIGCGKIAHRFAQGLKSLEGTELYAVASKTPGKAEDFAKKYGVSKFYSNYEDLVSDSDVDVVYIATTHNFHYDNTMLCLNNSKHVLCEKAFTINASEAEKLIKTAREKKLFLMEAMWTRFFPCIQELNKILDKKLIGEIKMLRADFGIRGDLDPEGRNANPNLGGGALLDLGVYPVSFASMIFKKLPSSIKSSARIGETGVDEQSSYLFEYDNGEMALLFSSFISETPHEALIVGTKGYVRIPDFFHPYKMFLCLNEDKEISVIEKKYESTGYNYEAREVMDCILAGKLESEVMSLDESLEIMKTMDYLRAQWGLAYPGEKN